MGNEFQDNNFFFYNIFQKALYHGLDEGFLKSEFSVPLYFGTLLNKTEYDMLCNKVDKSGLDLSKYIRKQDKIFLSKIKSIKSGKYRICFKGNK